MNKLRLAWKVSTPRLRLAVAFVLAVIALTIYGLLSRDESPLNVAPMQPAALDKTALAKQAALNLCRDRIEASAANRSSVDYHSFTAPPVIKQLPAGEWEVFVKFSAANAFNARYTFIARCTTTPEGTGLTGFDTQQSR